MRRLLVPFLLAAATAAPAFASGPNDICVGAGTGGPTLPHHGTTLHCRTVPSPLGGYCRYNDLLIDDETWVYANVCVPVNPPV